jgi:hypothetical protein
MALALGLGAVAVAAATTSSAAAEYKPVCILRPVAATTSACPPQLEGDFGATITPAKLPKDSMAPVAIKLHAEFSTSDGTPPPALREWTTDFGRDGSVDVKGLPSCPRSALELRGDQAARLLCRTAIVGTGAADFLNGADKRIRLPLTLFNGGFRDGTTTVFVSSSNATLTPTPIIATVRFRTHNGRSGLRAIATIPPLAGGLGSVLDFNLTFERLFHSGGQERSFAMARCLDGQLQASISAEFGDGTRLSADVLRSCTQKKTEPSPR